eukprot:3443600-Alexandrium_andersonii.AAC.1
MSLAANRLQTLGVPEPPLIVVDPSAPDRTLTRTGPALCYGSDAPNIPRFRELHLLGAGNHHQLRG